jgi:Pyruvate/2-oxoacid:ferredoxin oxidoreductase gamma subunit
VEREILLTGIGGQSVQLAAQILGRAAAREDRHVLMLGTYGGTMRGGNTDSTLVVGDAPITTPPIVSRAWSILAMHHQFFAPLGAKLVPGGVVVANASLFETKLDRDAYRVFDVSAVEIATELGNPLAASLVLLGAYAAITDIVALPSLLDAMHDSVPSYRRQHLETNAAALTAGFEAGPRGAAPAWAEDRAA